MNKFFISFLIIIALLLSSCGSLSSMNIQKDSNTSINLSISVPEEFQNRLMQFSSKPYSEIQFDTELIASKLENNGLKVEKSYSNKAELYSGTFSCNLDSLSKKDTELSKLISYKKGINWASLSFKLDRNNASSIINLFPFDSDIMEALQPPALYDNPVNTLEYKSMLSSLLGKKIINSMDNMPFVLTVKTPGVITESKGITIGNGNRTATITIPAIETIVLEKPIEFFIKWKQ